MFKITEKNRKWWIFAAMSAALSIVFLDQTAVSVGLPPIQKDLNASNVMLQWVINAYLVVLAALVIFGGKLGDVYGHKRTFLFGILIFVLASISCAAAMSTSWIIFSRAIQGVGGALMIPATGVIIAHAFDERERGKAIGLYVASASIFLSLGPMLSGLLVHYLSWRWIFWVNLPISLFSIVLAALAIPKKENRQQKKKLDWIGFMTSTVAITSLTIALMQSVSLGWTSPITIVLLTVAVIATITFFLSEKYAFDPIISFALFKKPAFLGAILCLLFIQCAFSSIVFWAILLQNVMGYSVLESGFFYLPVTLPVIFMAPLGGILRDRLGPRIPSIIGGSLVTLGALWISIFVFKGNYLAMLPGFILFGLGPSLIYSAIMATTLSAAPAEKRGMATGITSGVRQLGSALGVAILGSIISNLENSQLKTFIASHKAILSKFSAGQLTALISGAPSAKKLLVGFSADEINKIYHTIKSTFTFAFSMSMVATAIFAVLVIVISFRLPNQRV